MSKNTETGGQPLHPSTSGILQYFTYEHLPPHLRDISKQCAHLAKQMTTECSQGPELTTGLRKLLEAKDCFVRACVRPGDRAGSPPGGNQQTLEKEVADILEDAELKRRWEGHPLWNRIKKLV